MGEKTREELLADLEGLRRRVEELENGPREPETGDGGITRREVLRRAAWTAPVVLALHLPSRPASGETTPPSTTTAYPTATTAYPTTTPAPTTTPPAVNLIPQLDPKR